jgi:type I restriction enzyme S subunit
VDAKWIYYNLLNYDLSRLNEATGVPSINRDYLYQISFYYWEPEEQRKIAEILTTVDDAINQTEALIRKYQRIKQGLLQDLLTRGVDENGEVRQYLPTNFQNTSVGKIPKSWRIGSITDFATNFDSKRIPLKQEDRTKKQGDYPYYGASGIIDWIDDYIFNDELILVGEDGENVISRNLPLAFRVKGKCWVNNHAHVYKPLINVNITFLEELLESIDYSRFISGSAQPKLTQSILNKIPLPIPPSDEQQRIGSIIDVYNNLLFNEIMALKKFQILKQGLMQDLLTGEVRVNALLER